MSTSINTTTTALIRKLTTSAILLTSLFLAGTVLAQPRTVDKVIAVVDNDVILQSEFDLRVTQIKEQMVQREIAIPPEEELTEQIMDQLIIEHLQMQMASRAGIRVDDNMLNQALGDIAQQNNMNFNQFIEVLEEQGIYYVTREQIRKDITLGQLQNSAVSQRIDITRQEVENYLRSETGLAAIAPEYHIAHILIPVSAEQVSSQEEELANLLYQRLQDADADIRQIAATGEISRIKVNGGDLGWNKVESLPSLFQSIVPELEVGEAGVPFQSPAGFHIVQLLEIRGDVTMRVDQAEIRHIMIAPTEIRTEAQAETLVHELYQRIQDGEDFQDIARQNTDDINSMVSGGDLGWVSDGQLPEEYMTIVHATEIGGITEPFRVTSGWHIVEVLARRTEDLTEDNKRYQARLTLRERKFENEMQNWLTELRDTAYVDIREE